MENKELFWEVLRPSVTNKSTWEDVYQKFKERLWNEFWDERITADFGERGKTTDLENRVACLCPREPTRGIRCDYLKENKLCNHPEKKPPKPEEPKCEHTDWAGNLYQSYKYCPKCGEKL